MRFHGLLLALLVTLASVALAAQSTTGQQGGSTTPSPATNSATPPASDGTLSPASTDNAALQGRINEALRNEPTLGASHVTASVTDNSIDLSGTVGSTKDKQTASRIAASFDGNRKLNDNVVVTGAGHSDLAPNHPAMNNGGTGNVSNPATNSNSNNPQK